jgi:hypothetical protein
MSQTHILSRRRMLQGASAAGLFVVSTTMTTAVAVADEPSPKSKAEDVATLDAILAAVYDVISGPKGKARDWDRMRGLFIPEARLIPCVKNAAGKMATRTLTVEDYIKRSGPFLEKNGFFESEVARKVDKFGHIAQVFSTYESREVKDGPVIARGINSIQLFWDETRWWIVSIFWDSETPGNEIPPEYRAKK